MEKDKDGCRDIFCSLTQRELDVIKGTYEIHPDFDAQLPGEGFTIRDAPKGYVGIYHQFMLAGLRFPVFDFLETVLSQYKLHITQFSPNGIRKIICFTMLSRATGMTPDLTLFGHFYKLLPNSDWVSFHHRRPVGKELCGGLPESIKNWKEDFFFVKDTAFSGAMEFGITQGRSTDLQLDLSDKQKRNAKTLSDNSVKSWSDPNELLLGMAGLSRVWSNKERRPLYYVDGKKITLLTIMCGRCPIGAVTISEEILGPSVLDSVLEDDDDGCSIDSVGGIGMETSCQVNPLKGVKRPCKPDKIVKQKGMIQRSLRSAADCKRKKEPPNEMAMDESAASVEIGSRPTPRKRRHVPVAKDPAYVSDMLSSLRKESVSVTAATKEPLQGDVTTLSTLFPDTSASALKLIDAFTTTSAASLIDESAAAINASSTTMASDLTIPITSPKANPSDDLHSKFFGPMAVLPMEDLLDGQDNETISVSSPLPSKDGMLELSLSDYANTDSVMHVGSPLTLSESTHQIIGLDSTCTKPPPNPSEKMTPGMVTFANFSKVSSLLTPTSNATVNEGMEDESLRNAIAELHTVKLPALDIENVSDLDGLKEMHTSALKSMSWISAMVSRGIAKEREFNKMVDALEGARLGQEKLVTAHRELSSRVEVLTRRESELCLLNQDLEVKARDAVSQHLTAIQTMETTTKEFNDSKQSFAKNVSELLLACTAKDVRIKYLENQVSLLEESAASMSAQFELVSKNCEHAISDAAFEQDSGKAMAEKLKWLLEKGIAACFRSLLRSKEFGSKNASFQAACIEYGLHKCCTHMKTKYSSVLPDEPLPYSFPQAEEKIGKAFAQLVHHNFHLFRTLESGELTIDTLLKMFKAEDKSVEDV